MYCCYATGSYLFKTTAAGYYLKLLPESLRFRDRLSSNITGTEAHYFVFVSDVKELEDPDFTSFEYMQRDELNELAKVLAN